VRDLERLGRSVLCGILPRVYPQVLALAHEHQDAGRRAYITTAASQELADILARVLALDGAIGSQFSEVVDGVFTGKPTGLFIYGSEKAAAIEQLARSEGIDLAASYAYSDSASDLPMLRLVGHPVVVNPDSELARVARQEGWEVLRFDRLSRRLKTLAGVVGAAVAGGAGSVALVARGRRRRVSRCPRASERRWGAVSRIGSVTAPARLTRIVRPTAFSVPGPFSARTSFVPRTVTLVMRPACATDTRVVVAAVWPKLSVTVSVTRYVPARRNTWLAFAPLAAALPSPNAQW
jgi:phosphoserine phosphatase